MNYIFTSKVLEGLLLLCLLCSTTFAQQAQKVIPPSPNVASLGKYGDIPVSAYSGLPNISIPIYNIVSRDISIPISISYHASGIKVAEEASRVGLGWALNAGGVISRTIMGSDDFMSSILAYHTSTPPLPPDLVFSPYSAIDPNLYRQKACDLDFVGNFTLSDTFVEDDQAFDFQPDAYNFNFLNYSGKFILNRSKQAILSKQEKLLITVLDAAGNAWQVKTPDGMTYVFGQVEIYRQDGTGDHNSAWHLTNIISPLGETVTFNYESINNTSINTVGAYSEMRYVNNLVVSYNGCGDGTIPTTEINFAPPRTYSSVYLSSIDFRGGQVKFDYNNNDNIETRRLDVDGDRMLEKIRIFKKLTNGLLESTPFKVFSFDYSYFTGTKYDNDYIPNGGYSTNLALKRLKLLSLIESGFHNGQTIVNNPYVFNYYGDGTTDLPGKTSLARDHWGYFNDKQSNTSLIPSHEPGENESNYQPNNLVNAAIGEMGPERNTSSDANVVNVFSLKRITYPTKGWTEFEYEPHTYDAIESRVRDYSYFGRRSPYVYTEEREESITFAKAAGTHTKTLDLSDLFVGKNQTQSLVNYSVTFLFNGTLYPNPPECLSPSGNLYFCIENLAGECIYASDATCSGISCTTLNQAFMTPGIYTLKAYFPSSETTPPTSDIIVKFTYRAVLGFDPQNNARFSFAGGLRTAKITSHDASNTANNKVTRYNYNVWLDKNEDQVLEEYSSGKLMAMPQYSYVETRSNTLVPEECYYQNLLIRTSDSNIPLNGSAGGSIVGYDQVTVLYGENGENGKTVYQYENLPDKVFNYNYIINLNIASDGSGTILAIAPCRPPTISSTPYEKNGLLRIQTEYVNKGGEFVKIKQIENDWFASSNVNNGTIYYGFEKRIPIQTFASVCSANIFFYPALQSNWIHLNWTKETIFDQQAVSKFTSVTSTYTYEISPVHYQLKSKQQTTSNTSETILTEYTYPADYTSVNTGAIGLMKGDKYMHAAVIETVTSQVNNVAGKVIGASFTNYEITGTDDPATTTVDERKVLPASVASLEISSPLSSFTNSLNTGTAADENYRLKQTMGYNVTTGNLAEVQAINNIHTTYLWGYNHTYPVAEIKGASYSQIKTALGLQQTAEVNLGAGGLSTDQISALKTNLSQATMITTFTYDPLKGMTSQTDPSGITTTYEYDALGRLKLVKDHLGNIVKHFVYHYKASQ